MAHITLVRHGQANTGARDEESYDQLSGLGIQQARWLGAHMDSTGDRFARVFSGTLQRQADTALHIDTGLEVVQDPRLNEFAYFTMAQLMEDQHGLSVPDSREGFAAHLPAVFSAWQNGEIDGAPETHAEFVARITDVMDEIAAGPGRALVVTSGGVIGSILRRTLNLDTDAWAQMCLAIMNTSVHRLQLLLGQPVIAQFNNVPHLEHPDRHYAQTHL